MKHITQCQECDKERVEKWILYRCPDCGAEYMSTWEQWISVKDKLPEVIYENGACNVVLVRWRGAPVCGSEYQTSNTLYVNLYPERFTHWMQIPEPQSVTNPKEVTIDKTQPVKVTPDNTP